MFLIGGNLGMKDAGSERGLMGAKHGLTDRMDKLVGRTANVLGVVAGGAWLYGVLGQAQGWVWPTAAGLAVAGALVALYRAHQLERRLRDINESFDALERIAWAQHVKAVEGTLVETEFGGDLPAVRLSEYLTQLKRAGINLDGLNQALDALDEYERLREQRAGGAASKVAKQAADEAEG